MTAEILHKMVDDGSKLFLTAIYKGKIDKTMYIPRSKYTLIIQYQDREGFGLGRKLWIISGGKPCPYDSPEAFLDNWDVL